MLLFSVADDVATPVDVHFVAGALNVGVNQNPRVRPKRGQRHVPAFFFISSSSFSTVNSSIFCCSFQILPALLLLLLLRLLLLLLLHLLLCLLLLLPLMLFLLYQLLLCFCTISATRFETASRLIRGPIQGEIEMCSRSDQYLLRSSIGEHRDLERGGRSTICTCWWPDRNRLRHGCSGDARRGQGVSSGRRGGHEERLGSSFLLGFLLGGTAVQFCLT